MLSIVLAILLGIGFTLLASQNPRDVTFFFFDTALVMPLYIFTAFSFLAGILVSLLFHLFDLVRASSDIHARETQVHEVAKANENLQYQLQKHIAENVKLREELAHERTLLREQKIENTKQNVKNFFGKVRHSFS